MIRRSLRFRRTCNVPGMFIPRMENSGLRGADTDGPGEGTDLAGTPGRGAARNALQVRRSKQGWIKVLLAVTRRS